MKEEKYELTPVMVQYMDIKNKYKDCIVFYRLGDFYEMFFEDAKVASKELELTLTGKNCGLEERAPMCGVPFHAADSYISKLVENGHKVAICEQTEDPAKARGLVRREVIRVVTPGTNINPQALEESRNNYLSCVFCLDDGFGMASIDVSTGDFFIQEFDSVSKVNDEIFKQVPAELICNEAFMISGIDITAVREKLNVAVSAVDASYFDNANCEKVLSDHFKCECAKLGVDEFPLAKAAAGAVLRYALETQMISLEHITSIVPYISGKYMLIDSQTRRNLELTETMRDKNKKGSLLNVLDKTGTAMGARMLRSMVEQPLLEKEKIEERLDAVEELNSRMFDRSEIREYLNPIYDLERLAGRISYRSANPRDLIAFANSVDMIAPIKTALSDFNSKLIKELDSDLDPLTDLKEAIWNTLVDDPPINVREGGMIKDGYSEVIDELRSAKTEGKQWLADLEAREKEKTQIKNLRIKYNKVFGYYLEVTNSYKDLVPAEWIRKQTTTQSERYINSELKELEDKILNAEDRLVSLEYDIFSELRELVAGNILRIQKTAKKLAYIDSLCSLAYVAERNNYVRPRLNQEGIINIKNGRHPVVEKTLTDSGFVANNTFLNDKEDRIAIITGPNMAGKSTYMRQTALIVLMAQMGSFVPADEAEIGIVDRVFTRVGASDDLASGQSTFMVEMNEVSQIMKNATNKSLLILDEIGRGTSTFDGLAIAWAVVEYISDSKKLGAKTLFATHYHELTELEERLDCVKNYSIAVKEQGEDIIFLRKIVSGGADKSYGIQVARLAGLPDDILTRAKEIVELLSLNDISSHDRSEMIKSGGSVAEKYKIPVKTKHKTKESELEINQLSLFAERKQENILDDIRDMDLSAITPIQALNKLAELQEELRNSNH